MNRDLPTTLSPAALAAEEAFDSAVPGDAIRTVVVTGSYSAIVNAYVEILKATAGSRLTGLLPHRRPHAEQFSTQCKATAD